MKSILINFSGHPLSGPAKLVLSENFSIVVDSKPKDIIFDDSVESQIKGMIAALPVKIDGSLSITIIPPGQATFALFLVSYIHGLIGHFPNICYLERSSDGLYMPRMEYEIQPQGIRAAGRRFRLSSYEV